MRRWPSLFAVRSLTLMINNYLTDCVALWACYFESESYASKVTGSVTEFHLRRRALISSLRGNRHILFGSFFQSHWIDVCRIEFSAEFWASALVLVENKWERARYANVTMLRGKIAKGKERDRVLSRKSRRAQMPARFSWSTSFQRQPDLYSFMALATWVFAHEIIRFYFALLKLPNSSHAAFRL